jgi:hypothetical protein
MQTESLVHGAPVPASPNVLASPASLALPASSPPSLESSATIARACRSGSEPEGASVAPFPQPHATSAARHTVHATQGSQRRGGTSVLMSTA